jgi:hypothetical protein
VVRVAARMLRDGEGLELLENWRGASFAS